MKHLVYPNGSLRKTNYYLDLLGKEGEYGYFGATDGNKEYDNLHDQPIYKYDTDGWKAIHIAFKAGGFVLYSIILEICI